jgi:CRP/FNR family transcriptional regulator
MVNSSTSCIACSVHGKGCFCSLPDAVLSKIDLLGSHLRVNAHSIVKREGYSADRVFIVCMGRLKLSASSADGKLLLLRIAGPGDILGIASLLQGSRYRVSAETLEPCEFKVITRANFLTLMASFPEISQNTAKAVSRDYDAALLSARRLALSSSAAGKLAATLLDWALSDHRGVEGPMEFIMPLTHEELGCMAGLSRETVTRLLGRFRAEDLIALEGERMSLLHPEQLTAIYC